MNRVRQFPMLVAGRAHLEETCAAQVIPIGWKRSPVVVNERRQAFNGGMTAALREDGADPDWEYAPLRIPADVSRTSATAQLSLHAEFGGWELARVVRYVDGTRRVWLRRKRRPASALPLPGLSV